MRALIYAIILGLVRTAIAAFGGSMVGEGLDSTVIEEAAIQLTAGIVLILVACWGSYKNKLLEFAKTHFALNMPEGTTYEEVQKHVREAEAKNATKPVAFGKRLAIEWIMNRLGGK